MQRSGACKDADRGSPSVTYDIKIDPEVITSPVPSFSITLRTINAEGCTHLTAFVMFPVMVVAFERNEDAYISA